MHHITGSSFVNLFSVEMGALPGCSSVFPSLKILDSFFSSPNLIFQFTFCKLFFPATIKATSKVLKHSEGLCLVLTLFIDL